MANMFLSSSESGNSNIFDNPALTRAKLGLIYGSTIQSFDNTLNNLAQLIDGTTAANKIIKLTGNDSFSLLNITSHGEAALYSDSPLVVSSQIPQNTSDLSNNSNFTTLIDVSNNGFVKLIDVSNNGYIKLIDVSNNGYVKLIDVSNNGFIKLIDVSNNGYIQLSDVSNNLSEYNNDSGFLSNLTNQSLIINQENSNELAFSKSNGLQPVKTIIEVLNHTNTSTGDKTIYLPQLNTGVTNDKLVGETCTATLINKTIDCSLNTILNLPSSSGLSEGDNISLLTNNSGYITSSSLSGYMVLDGNSTITGTQTFTDTNFTQYGNVLSADGIAKLILGDSDTYISNEKNANLLRINTNRTYVSFNKPLFINDRIISSVDGIWEKNSSNGKYYVGVGNTSGVDGVGIGTDSPEAQLQINQSVAFTNPYQETSQTSAIHLVPSSASSHSAITFAFANNNKRGVGAICGSSSYGMEFIANRSRHHYFYGSTTNVTLPATTTNDLIMIMRGDNKRVGIGTTGPSYTLEVNGSVAGASWAYTSDDRYKHNEKDVNNALETINKLKIQHYYKTNKKFDISYNFQLDSSGNPLLDKDNSGNVIDNSGNVIIITEETGIIAQSVKKIPELAFCVTGDEQLYLNYNNIFCYNIQATQELDKLHQIQKNKIIELKHTVAKLQKEINYLQLIVKGDKIGIQLKKTIAELQKEMYYLQEQDKKKFAEIDEKLKNLTNTS